MTTLLMLFALVAQDDAAAAAAAAATAALDKFKVDYKSKDVAARTAAVGELAKTQHEKVHARLGQLLGTDESGVRIAAAKNLAMVAENKKKVVSYLIAAITPNCSALSKDRNFSRATTDSAPGTAPTQGKMAKPPCSMK
jgi:hypothetical protein